MAPLGRSAGARNAPGEGTPGCKIFPYDPVGLCVCAKAAVPRAKMENSVRRMAIPSYLIIGREMWGAALRQYWYSIRYTTTPVILT